MSNVKPPEGYKVINQGTSAKPWWSVEIDPSGDPESRDDAVAVAVRHRESVQAKAYARVAAWYADGCPIDEAWKVAREDVRHLARDYIAAGLPGWEPRGCLPGREP